MIWGCAPPPARALYKQEHDRHVPTAAALRLETVKALLSGTSIDAGAASQRLRYELHRHHLAFVVWSDDDAEGGDLTALEHAATEFGHAMRAKHTLVVPLGSRLVAAWIGAWNPIVGGSGDPSTWTPKRGILAVGSFSG